MAERRWGMIGGGEGSQIGPAHRMASGLDGRFRMTAAALDADPDKGRAYAQSLGVAADRAYGTWQDMLEGERDRDDRLDLVTIATPNVTHFEIAKSFLEAGFHVLCEKPLTVHEEDAAELVRMAAAHKRICAVNYGYSGYPLIRQARAMVQAGELGAIRLIKVEFAHGFHANAEDADNPRIRWRYDPAQMGISAQFADCGIHALHLASFVADQNAESLQADFLSSMESRMLEDDAMVNVRMDGGATCRLWTSAIAVGRMHGLTMQIFGEKGGLRWAQEQPNQLYFTPLDSRTQIIERGSEGLHASAAEASRITIGHPEGMVSAFANLYRDIDTSLDQDGEVITTLPQAVDGLRSIAAIRACVDSAKADGQWVDARPASLV